MGLCCPLVVRTEQDAQETPTTGLLSAGWCRGHMSTCSWTAEYQMGSGSPFSTTLHLKLCKRECIIFPTCGVGSQIYHTERSCFAQSHEVPKIRAEMCLLLLRSGIRDWGYLRHQGPSSFTVIHLLCHFPPQLDVVFSNRYHYVVFQLTLPKGSWLI